MSTVLKERRRFVRLNILVDIVYVKKTLLEKEKLTMAKNISIGGICLIVYEKLQEQDSLDLKIYLPEDKAPIVAVGRVVWIKEFMVGDGSKGKRFDVGIEFIEISNEDVSKIEKYVFTYR